MTPSKEKGKYGNRKLEIELEMDGGLVVGDKRWANKGGIYSNKHLVSGKLREGITEIGQNPRLVMSMLAGNK